MVGAFQYCGIHQMKGQDLTIFSNISDFRCDFSPFGNIGLSRFVFEPCTIIRNKIAPKGNIGHLLTSDNNAGLQIAPQSNTRHHIAAPSNTGHQAASQGNIDNHAPSYTIRRMATYDIQ